MGVAKKFQFWPSAYKIHFTCIILLDSIEHYLSLSKFVWFYYNNIDRILVLVTICCFCLFVFSLAIFINFSYVFFLQ